MTHSLSFHTAVPAALLVALVSCAVPYQPEEADVYPDAADSLLVNVVFSASGGSTKVTGVTDAHESAIGRWAVFAFDNSSGHYSRGTDSGGSPLTIQLIAGRSYTCYAMVNYPLTGAGAFDPSAVRSPEDLIEKVAYLGDNTESALLMFGGSMVVPLQGVTQDVTINVRRLVSRIDLRGLSVDFTNPHLTHKSFTLRGIYVTNAYRSTRYGYDYSFSEISDTRSAWYNTGGWHRGESPESGIDALLGDLNIGAVISAGNPYTVNHSFYAFPNPAVLSDDIRTLGGWTRRCTRLVIEASIDSDIVYYTINVPGMVRNCIYAASNVVIHGRGSNDPEIIDTDPDIIEAHIEPVIDDSWDGAGNITLE